MKFSIFYSYSFIVIIINKKVVTKQLLFYLISAKDHKETAALGEVFHEPSTAPFRPERERVLEDVK